MQSNTMGKAIYGAMASAMIFILFFSVAHAAVGDITISVPGSDPDQGSSFTSEVKVDAGSQVLGSYSLTFLFDRMVLRITGVQGGLSVGFTGIPIHGSIETANTTGELSIASFQGSLTEPKNLVSIFKITFSVIGAPGSSSTLSCSVADLTDPDFNQIPHQVLDAEVTVNGETGVYLYVDPEGNCSRNIPCYRTLQGAINAAPHEYTVLAKAGNYGENMSLHMNKLVFLQGGCNDAYTAQSSYTESRSLTISEGAVTVNRLILR